VKQFFRILSTCTLTLLALASRSFADDRIKEGKDALSRGDYLKAIESFRDAAQDDKKNPEGFYLLGMAYLLADSTDQAIPAAVQARELSPNDPQIYLLLGDIYWKQNIPAAALEQYKHATELDSTKGDVWLKVAQASRKLRQYNIARDAYLKVIQLDSTNVIALKEVGIIYYKSKQWQNALPLYFRLAKMYPDSLTIQTQYVMVLYKNDYCKDVIPVAKWVLDRNPENEEISTIYADCLGKSGQDSIAIREWEKHNPDSMKTEDLMALARAYKRTGEYEKAIPTFLRILKRDSTRCEVPYDLGTTYMKVKDYAKAVPMFEKKIVCDTSSGYQFASLLNEAMCWMQLKKFKEAKEAVLGSLRFRPDNIQAWQVLAQTYGQLDQIDSETVAYKKVIDIAVAGSENGDAGKYNAQLLESYRTIGVRYLIRAIKLEGEAQKKMYALSVEYLKKALPFDPKNCQLLQWTAQAFQNSNNKEEAGKYYCKLIANCPNSKEAADAKKQMEAMGVKCGG